MSGRGEEFSHKSCHYLSLAGHTKSQQECALEAVATIAGRARSVMADVELAGTPSHHVVYSNSALRLVHVEAYDSAGKSLSLTLNRLGDNEVLHASLISHADAEPMHFRISVPELVKTRRLADSVLDGRADEIIGIAGEQSADAVPDEWEPLTAGNSGYEDFLRDTSADKSDLPLIPGWCIAIYCVPIIGIGGLLIRRCR
jgi:hypothetical protein